jgi:DNA-binding response OmpR family regulator
MPSKDTKTIPKKSKNILIIEDERPLAHALELKMKHEGYETKVVYMGGEGLREAETGKYDLILLDLILPEMDGFSILQEMRDKKVKTPVIVLSNLGQDEDRKKAEEFGAKKYLVKSNVPLSDIVKVVKSIF